MSEPFLGEIRMFAGNFAPRGNAFCDGQLLAVSQNDALFSLYGTIYGGDGRTTFGLPDLRGRVPVHAGNGAGLTNRPLGQKGGAEEETITISEMGAHSHTMQGNSTDGTSQTPIGNLYSKTVVGAVEFDVFELTQDTSMGSQMVENTGGSQAHTNLMPTLCINFICALVGTFPSRS